MVAATKSKFTRITTVHAIAPAKKRNTIIYSMQMIKDAARPHARMMVNPRCASVTYVLKPPSAMELMRSTICTWPS